MKYYLGLDIGTNSIGWAVTDENYNIVKRGKNGALWGVRMFDEAQDASVRRTNRNARRRLERRKERIKMIRNIFSDEIRKKDINFYKRLDESFFKIEDKSDEKFVNLFPDLMSDKEYGKKYPTIYHLRKDLMESKEKFDIRLIFLAVSNIIKYRGNFLNPGSTFNLNDINQIKEIFNEYNQILLELDQKYENEEFYSENYFESLNIYEGFFDDLKNVLCSKDLRIRDKKIKLAEIFGTSSKSINNQLLIPLLVGSTLKTNSVSFIKNLNALQHEIDITSEKAEEQIEGACEDLGEIYPLINFIYKIKQVYDYCYLCSLLESYSGYSDAMVGIYNKHFDDLKRLKKFVKTYIPEKYAECFKENSEKVANYCSYIGFCKIKNKTYRFKHCSRLDFYKYIRNLISSVEEEKAQKEKEYFLDQIEKNNFLCRQNSSQNGVFPMQLHLHELETILNNQSQFYDFLNLEDEEFKLNTKEKILCVFKYKIPYYVGPLNNKSKYSWVSRSNDKIYPWNFNDVVNLEETESAFIRRMQNKCTYLKGETDFCLPKNSLIYSEYNCLSYLNKLSINGKLLDYKIKMDIFNNVFLNSNYLKPKKKDIIQYIKNNYSTFEDLRTSSGKEIPEVNCDMSSYIRFKELFGNDFDKRRDDIENIILDITIFEDKATLEKRLRSKYELDEKQIKTIKGFNYKEYCSLSKNLICGLIIKDPTSGEEYGTLLDVMRKTNYNLQEILYNEYFRYIDVIDEYNKKLGSDCKLSPIDFIDNNISVSPFMKRSLIQSLHIIDEIEQKILKAPIDKYFIECTRTNKEVKRASKSRYDSIKELYGELMRSCNDENDKKHILETEKLLDSQVSVNKNILSSDMMYLYFTQLGKCMYTLKPLDINKLSLECDIDHIYPQSLIKDDSLNNRVLVLKSINEKKKDRPLFELDDELPKERFAFYSMLLSRDLIKKEKYRRLTKKSFDESELEEFLNRQIVQTNQSVKALIQFLKLYKNVPSSNIIFSKAENVSRFRDNYNIVKSRLANNFHHAHDAYLNIFVGDVLNSYYISRNFNTHIDYERIRNNNETINPERILSKDKLTIYSKVLDLKSLREKVKNSIETRHDIKETLKTATLSVMIPKVTINPALKEGNIPVKTTDLRKNIEKYGGFKSLSFAKYEIIKCSDNLRGNTYFLEAIPTTYKDNVEKYINSCGYTNFSIINDNIKINSVVEYKDLIYTISGKSGNSYVVQNHIDRFFDHNSIRTIKKVEKYLSNLRKSAYMEEKDGVLLIGENRDGIKTIMSKNEIITLLLEVIRTYSKPIYSYNTITNYLNTLNEYNPSCSSVKELIALANELLQLLKTNERKTANLSMIGLSSQSGTLSISKRLVPGMKFISESVTGFYKKTLFEVPQ